LWARLVPAFRSDVCGSARRVRTARRGAGSPTA
jgi:hypothetical protein